LVDGTAAVGVGGTRWAPHALANRSAVSTAERRITPAAIT
jgi:hypothetical protein